MLSSFSQSIERDCDGQTALIFGAERRKAFLTSFGNVLLSL